MKSSDKTPSVKGKWFEDRGFTLLETVIGLALIGIVFGGIFGVIKGQYLLVSRAEERWNRSGKIILFITALESALADVAPPWWEAPPEWKPGETGFSLSWREGGRRQVLEVMSEKDTWRIGGDVAVDGSAFFLPNWEIELNPLEQPGGGFTGIALEVSGGQALHFFTGSRSLIPAGAMNGLVFEK